MTRRKIDPFLLSLMMTLLVLLSAAGPGLAWGFNWPDQNSTTVPQVAQEPTANNDVFWSRWKARTEQVEAADAQQPITIKGGVRHPLIFFHQFANSRWALGRLFSFLFLVSALLKLFLPRLTDLATKRCRTNCYASLTSAFVYATVLVTIVRYGFFSEDLTPMGIFTFGLLQLSFALGCCLGVNLFAQNLYNLVTVGTRPTGTTAKVFIYGLCLAAVAGVMTVVSLIPYLGHLPRVGNRIVMLVAALGLGGLVNLVVGPQKPEP
jgi:hypothetical protein